MRRRSALVAAPSGSLFRKEETREEKGRKSLQSRTVSGGGCSHTLTHALHKKIAKDLAGHGDEHVARLAMSRKMLLSLDGVAVIAAGDCYCSCRDDVCRFRCCFFVIAAAAACSPSLARVEVALKKTV